MMARMRPGMYGDQQGCCYCMFHHFTSFNKQRLGGTKKVQKFVDGFFFGLLQSAMVENLFLFVALNDEESKLNLNKL
jgi:hypothetical protein